MDVTDHRHPRRLHYLSPMIISAATLISALISVSCSASGQNSSAQAGGQTPTTNKQAAPPPQRSNQSQTDQNVEVNQNGDDTTITIHCRCADPNHSSTPITLTIHCNCPKGVAPSVTTKPNSANVPPPAPAPNTSTPNTPTTENNNEEGAKGTAQTQTSQNPNVPTTTNPSDLNLVPLTEENLEDAYRQFISGKLSPEATADLLVNSRDFNQAMQTFGKLYQETQNLGTVNEQERERMNQLSRAIQARVFEVNRQARRSKKATAFGYSVAGFVVGGVLGAAIIRERYLPPSLLNELTARNIPVYVATGAAGGLTVGFITFVSMTTYRLWDEAVHSQKHFRRNSILDGQQH